MAADGSIIQFRDELNGNAKVYPLTHQNAVLGEDSQPLQTYITEYNVSHHHTNKITSETDSAYDTSIFTLSDAIATVPNEYQRGGLKLSFNSVNGGVESYTLDSSVWDSSVSHWKRFDAKNFQEKFTELDREVIYDVSAHNNNAVFESLQSLLSNSDINSLIPTSIRCGGMSIRFINSYNKYVQYRYTGIETTGNPNPFLDIANWRCTDSTIISESTEVKEFILPNELNKWGKIKSFTINRFQGAQEVYVNEYMWEFTVSGDNFTLTLPEGVHWVEEPTWENGYTYQVSIVNNLAVFAGWEAQTNE